MVSLSTTVARHRVFYPRPIPAMPDILMIALPPEFRDAPSALGRHYPILIETIAEQGELEAYLEKDFAVPCLPDLLDRRPSELQADHVTVAHYGPPVDDWPYVMLCRWPPELTVATPSELKMFVRGAYTIELFNDREQLEQASEKVLTLLKRRRQTRVEIILPHWSAAPDGSSH